MCSKTGGLSQSQVHHKLTGLRNYVKWKRGVGEDSGQLPLKFTSVVSKVGSNSTAEELSQCKELNRGPSILVPTFPAQTGSCCHREGIAQLQLSYGTWQPDALGRSDAEVCKLKPAQIP